MKEELPTNNQLLMVLLLQSEIINSAPANSILNGSLPTMPQQVMDFYFTTSLLDKRSLGADLPRLLEFGAMSFPFRAARSLGFLSFYIYQGGIFLTQLPRCSHQCSNVRQRRDGLYLVVAKLGYCTLQCLDKTFGILIKLYATRVNLDPGQFDLLVVLCSCSTETQLPTRVYPLCPSV